MKMWIGIFDGSRQGLVIAPTKARAIAVVGSSRSDFDGHWVQRSDVDPSLDPEVLYTRPFNGRDVPWFRGRCPL
jgi:hypothetical protein